MADLLALLTALGAFAAFFAIGWWFLSCSLYRNLECDRDIGVQVCACGWVNPVLVLVDAGVLMFLSTSLSRVAMLLRADGLVLCVCSLMQPHRPGASRCRQPSN